MPHISAISWQGFAMLGLACALLLFSALKKREPLLFLPLAFGMLLANLPGAFAQGAGDPGLIFSAAMRSILPCLLFLCIGMLTDFGPLLAKPSGFLFGAAPVLGIALAAALAAALGFIPREAAAVGMAGSLNGPAAVYFTATQAPGMSAGVTLTAYASVALLPAIQPGILRMLTTQKERTVKMEKQRKVGRTERIVFPVAGTVITALLVPGAAAPIGMLMLGNFVRECGLINEKTQAALRSITTILLGLGIGLTANGPAFLQLKTLLVVLPGLAAACVSTAGSVLLGKLLCAVTGGRVNPLVGAEPAVAQRESVKVRPGNFLRMHAMGPAAAALLASTLVAGILAAVPR